MTKPTFAGAGSQQQERRERERLRVLGGDGENGKRAVLYDEIAALVRLEVSRQFGPMLTGDDESDRRAFVEDFQGEGNLADFYRWQFAGPYSRRSSLYAPPAGTGGGAIFLERETGVGTWLAALAAGAEENTRLFLKGTHASPDVYGPWREVYTEFSALGPVAMGPDGRPQGALFQEISNANGRAVRSADGRQEAHSGAITLTRASGDAMSFAWTFPAAFVGTPFIGLVLPANSGGAFTSLSPIDVGATYSGNGTTSITVGCYRAAGGTSFPVGASIAGARVIAQGVWR